MLEFNTVYCMECMNGLKQIDNDSVDLIFADTPFNLLEIIGDCRK